MAEKKTRRRSEYWSTSSDSETVVVPKILMDRLYKLICCPLCHNELNNQKMLPCQHTFCSICVSEMLLDDFPSCAVCSVLFLNPEEGVSQFPENIVLRSLMDNLKNHMVRCFIDCGKDEEMGGNESFRTVEEIEESRAMQVKDSHSRREKARHACEAQWPSTANAENAANNHEIRSVHFEEAQNIIDSDDLEDIDIKDLLDSDDTVKMRNTDVILDCQDFYYSENSQQKALELLDAMKDIPTVDNVENRTEEMTGEDSVFETLMPEQSSSASTPAGLEMFNLHLLASVVDEVQKTEETAKSKKSKANQPENPTVNDVGDSLYYRCRNYCSKYRIGECVIDKPLAMDFDCDTLQILVLHQKKPEIYVFNSFNHDRREVLFLQTSLNKKEMKLLSIGYSSFEYRIYVVDNLHCSVYQLTRDGKLIRTIGSKGEASGCFEDPRRVAVDSKGWIFVTDAGKRNVQVFDNEGTFEREFDGSNREENAAAAAAANNNCFREPVAIAVSYDRIAVCDEGNNSVQVLSRMGDPLFTINTYQNDKLLGRPTSVVIDNHGFIFVGDDRSGGLAMKESRVHIYRPDGVYIRSFGAFHKISDLAISDDGHIAVCDSTVPVIKIF